MERYKRILLLSLKIGIGASLAIAIAEALHLQYAVSAGTVALLTLMTSKWDTLQLSLSRLLTFVVTIVLAWLLFSQVHILWVDYGILLALVVLISESLGWRATISVNAVVAAHLVTSQDLSMAAIENEFLLVVIGIVVAVVLNLFHGNLLHQRQIVANMRDTEKRMQDVMRELAACLSGQSPRDEVQKGIVRLEGEILLYAADARAYRDNTFHAHTQYYAAYFEMRFEQCRILLGLYHKAAHLHDMPDQAELIADYLTYLSGHVVEVDEPKTQLEKLSEVVENLRSGKAPDTWEDFENRAILYLFVLELENLLKYKADFVASLDDAQRARYWQSREKPGRAQA